MLKSRSGRSGFTLPEVLVTVAIVAILAAVVVPAVTNQISKGETGSVASAITGFQTGLTGFVTDVRKYPGFLSQLTKKIAVTDKDVDLRVYTTSDVASWKGPYTSTVDHASGDSISVGMGVFAKDSLRDTSVASRKYVTMYLATADTAVARQLDVLFDHGDGSTNGILRYTVDTDSVKFRRVQLLLTPR